MRHFKKTLNSKICILMFGICCIIFFVCILNVSPQIAEASNSNTRWFNTRYNIQYFLDGGKNSSKNPRYFTNSQSNIKLENPTKPYFDFAGWEDGSDIIDTSQTCCITKTALWVPKEYTILYNLNGGLNSLYNPPSYTYFDNSFSLQNPTKKGYRFEGWKEGDTIETSTAKTIVKTAQWSLIECKINYELNGGKNNINNPSSYNITDEDIHLQNPTREGYTFIAWLDDDVIQTANAVNVTVMAKWKINSYIVKFENPDGTILNIDNMHYEQGQKIVAPTFPEQVDDLKYSYEFLRWETDFDIATEDMTIKAVYKPIFKNYHIKFYNLNDKVFCEKYQCHYGDLIDEPMPLIKAEDEFYTYQFSGWTNFSGVVEGDADCKPIFIKKCKVLKTAYELNDAILAVVKNDNGFSKDSVFIIKEDDITNAKFTENIQKDYRILSSYNASIYLDENKIECHNGLYSLKIKTDLKNGNKVMVLSEERGIIVEHKAKVKDGFICFEVLELGDFVITTKPSLPIWSWILIGVSSLIILLSISAFVGIIIYKKKLN